MSADQPRTREGGKRDVPARFDPIVDARVSTASAAGEPHLSIRAREVDELAGKLLIRDRVWLQS